MIGEPVALQPTHRGFQVLHAHLRARLIAGASLQDGVVAVIQPLPFRRLHGAFVLDGLLRHHLADALPQPAFQHRAPVEHLGLHGLDAFGAQGGNSAGSSAKGGYGAEQGGSFTLTEGEKLEIIVGGQGGQGGDETDGGGGGGVSLYGGGGGGGSGVNSDGGNGFRGASGRSNATGGYAGGSGSRGGNGGFGGGGGEYTGGRESAPAATGGGTSFDAGTGIAAQTVGSFDSGDGELIITRIVACFRRGTLIRTALGEMPVELLAIGDTVVTASGEHRLIKWIGRRSYTGRFLAASPNAQPIRFRAGSFGSGLPRRDLLVH
jgi:hypothetical protein